MKKRLKHKSYFAQQQDPADIAGLILKVQQQLTFLEKKIDTLIGQSPEKPFERQHHPKPFRRFDHPRRQAEARQDNNYSQRVLHKAICADCNKECEVPFRPSQDRPVYCRDCFSKRKAGGLFKEKVDFVKKRPAVKRRKARQ